MKQILFIFAMLVATTVNAGVDQILARNLGGTQKIELSEGERLVNITWKKDTLWILTTKDSSITPRKYEFKENTVLGVLEGTVKIIEK